MNEDKPKPEEGKEPGLETDQEPEFEVVEELEAQADVPPAVEAERGAEPEGGEEDKAGAVEEPEIEAVESDREPEPEEGEPDEIQDRLELDRMEVKPEAEIPEAEQEERVEEEEAEPPEVEEEEPGPPSFLARLSKYWIWIVACLVGLSVVSVLLLFLLAAREETAAKKAGYRVEVVRASLGGERYVHFNLWGPFNDPKGETALRRGLPKVRNDLILSGSRPDVARAIQENDLYFLEQHILESVSAATGVPIGKLDLKGLSVTRYTDEAEVDGRR